MNPFKLFHSAFLRQPASIVVAIVLVLSLNSTVHAQDVTEGNTNQLNIIQSVLSAKIETRDKLRERIKNAAPDAIADLQLKLSDLNGEIRSLRASFQQVAVGSVDLSIFTEEASGFDWQAEVTQIMMPIVQNLKSLTEKPRKIENLKSRIATGEEQTATIEAALEAINKQIDAASEEQTKSTLELLLYDWIEKKAEARREIELATVQLANLQRGDVSLAQAIKNHFFDFLKGRGLTLLLAVVAGMLIWYFMRLITALLSKRSKSEDKIEHRTRQRLVHYSFRLVTFLLILIAVIVVFYTRGDVLLLGVAFLFAAGIILGLRNTIPQFWAETRVLLNLGAIREDERVVYQGLPYRITALNMYSTLRNPELAGVIRLPLKQVVSMISRPAGNELWFPTKKGDYIVFRDSSGDNSEGRVMRVVDQTTELVELENVVGTKSTIPTVEFFNMTFDNLSRTEFFSVTGKFRVSYKHQAICNSEIPERLRQDVTKALSGSVMGEHVENVQVELDSANPSSIDYWICISLKSSAARSYKRTLRLIQQTCVDTCREQNWEIPFPQLKLSKD